MNHPIHRPAHQRIASRIEEWKKQGLISGEQAIEITDFEARRPESNWIIGAFITLGVVVIGIGTVSVIAANWFNISATLKLAIDLLLLLGVAGLSYRKRTDAWILLFLLLCLASIGLVAQVFHTGGEIYEALLLWSIITLPIVLLGRHRFIAFLWSGLFLASLFLWLSQARWMMIEEVHTLILMPVLIALLSAGFNSEHRESQLVQAFRYWVVLSAIPAIGLLDLLISGNAYPVHKFERVVATTTGVAAIAAWRFAMDRSHSRFTRIAVVSLLTIYAFEGWLATLGLGSEVLGAVMTLVLLVLAAVHFGLLGYRRIFNALTLLVGLRFLILYFQALGGLAATGVGLIISGCFIIGLVWAWNKSRPKRQGLLEDLMKWNLKGI